MNGSQELQGTDAVIEPEKETGGGEEICPWHGGREALGWPAGLPGPGRTNGMKSDRGEQKTSLPFVGRLSGHIFLYEEREAMGGGGEGHTDRYGEIQYHQQGSTRSLRGLLSPTKTHPNNPHLQVLPATLVEQVELSSTGTLGRKSGAARQALDSSQSGKSQSGRRLVKLHCQ